MTPLQLASGGLLAMAGAIGVGRFVYTPILPYMADELALSQSQAGVLASANYAGYLLGALVAAIPALPGAQRGWLLGSLLVSALTTAAMSLPQQLLAMAVLRFVGGGASAFVLVFASSLVLQQLAGHRPRLAAVHFAGVGAGIFLSAALVTATVAAGGGWRAMWLCCGIAVLAMLLLVARWVPGNALDEAPPTALDGDAGGSLGWLVLAYGLFGFGYIITATFIVLIVRSAPNAQSIEPVIWMLVGLAAIPSVAIWTRIGARIGLRLAFAAACLVEAIGVAASVAWQSTSGMVIAAVFLGGTFMGLTALGLVKARQLAGQDQQRQRRALALMTAAFGLGQIIGPVFAGYLGESSGTFFAPSMTAAAALAVAAVIVVVAVKPQSAHDRESIGDD